MSASTERLLRRVRSLLPRPDASDAELLTRFVQSRDESAFAELVSRHAPLVLGTCRRILHNSASAEDAAQAVFLVLASKAATIQRPETLTAWLHQTARHLAFKQRQAEVRRRQRETNRYQASESVDPLDELSAREVLAICDEEIQHLPEQYRLPVILCCLEGCSQEEAAQRLGWTPGSVKGRLERGRLRLQQRLAQRGLGLSAALAAWEVVRGGCAACPPAFVSETTRLAFQVQAGGDLAPEVAALAAHGLRGGMMFRMKLLVALVLLLGAFSVGFATLVHPGKAVTPLGVAPLAEKSKARTDRHGDPLPEGAIARLGTIRWRTDSEIRWLAVADDGAMVAAACVEGLSLFDGAGKLLTRHRPSNTYFNQFAFSPDGKRLGCAASVPGPNHRTRNVVQILEVPSAKVLRQFDVDFLLWVSWTRDELQAVSMDKGAVLVHSLTSGKVQRFVADVAGDEQAQYICRGVLVGNILAVSDQKRMVHVWDLTGGKKTVAFDLKAPWIRNLTLSQNGRWLAALVPTADNKNSTQIWDVTTGKLIHTLSHDQLALHQIAFTPDGQTLASVGWHDVRFWDVATGKERNRSQGLRSIAPNVAFARDGKTMVTAERYSGTLHVWDLPTRSLRSSKLAGHTNRPGQADFSLDGKRVVTHGSLDGQAIVWDLATTEPVLTIPNKDWGRGCAFSADGRSLFALWSGDRLNVSDAATGKLQHELPLGNTNDPKNAPSGLELALSADRKTVVVLGVAPNRQVGREMLLCGWDADSRKQLFRRTRPISAAPVAISPDARILADAMGSDGKIQGANNADSVIRLEDLATGEHIIDLPPGEWQSWALGFSIDGRLLATYSAGRSGAEPVGKLRLWEVSTASEVLPLEIGDQRKIAFSRNGRLLAFDAPKRAIAVWDLWQGKEVRRLTGVDADVTSLTFSPDGNRLISGMSDSTLLVWDVSAENTVRATPLTQKELDQAWTDLAGDARQAFAASGKLAASPRLAVALIHDRVKPSQPADAKVVQQLIDQLDAADFGTRETARQRLTNLSDSATAALTAALERKLPLEQHRRIQSLLRRLRPPITDPEVLRAFRAVAVLEAIGSPEARRHLQTLSLGSAGTRLTREATAALSRLRAMAP